MKQLQLHPAVFFSVLRWRWDWIALCLLSRWQKHFISDIFPMHRSAFCGEEMCACHPSIRVYFVMSTQIRNQTESISCLNCVLTVQQTLGLHFIRAGVQTFMCSTHIISDRSPLHKSDQLVEEDKVIFFRVDKTVILDRCLTWKQSWYGLK